MQIADEVITVYTVGGKKFLNLKDAEDYEEKLTTLLKYAFYTVMYEPDLTEGRGYSKHLILAVSDDQCCLHTALQYLVNSVGSPLAFVMGVSPTNNWVISNKFIFADITPLTAFLRTKVSWGIGGHKEMEPRDLVVLNEKGEKVRDSSLYDIVADWDN